eukprot:gene20902-15414_t
MFRVSQLINNPLKARIILHATFRACSQFHPSSPTTLKGLSSALSLQQQ